MRHYLENKCKQKLPQKFVLFYIPSVQIIIKIMCYLKYVRISNNKWNVLRQNK